MTRPAGAFASTEWLGVVNEWEGHGMTKWTKPEYRIVRDRYRGYEVQIRRWWHWPAWFQLDFSNTHSSVELAEKYAAAHAAGPVKYLGRLGD